MSPIGLVLAGLIGVTLGLLGGGGSILTVPIFVYVLGYAAKPAIATSLAVVGATSLLAAINHARAKNIDAQAAVWFAPSAMAASHRSMPVLAVCHSDSGTTRAGTP